MQSLSWLPIRPGLSMLLLASNANALQWPYHGLAAWCSELRLSPSVPFLSSCHLRVLDHVLRSCLLRFLLTLGLHFLSFDGLEVFRNIVQMSSSWTICSISLIITLRLYRFEGEDHRRKVPFLVSEGVCCKYTPCCVDFEHLLGFSLLIVSPHLFSTGKQEEWREKREEGQAQ